MDPYVRDRVFRYHN